MTTTSTRTATQDREATDASILSWFFEEVLPRWDAVADGTSDEEDAEALAGFCALPMLLATCGTARRVTDRDDVRRLVESQILTMRLADNHHILVPDSRVTSYSKVAGALDVIWSHRRLDGGEIARVAVHYDIAHLDGGWRITGLHVTPTDKATLHGVWVPTPSNDVG